MMPSAPRWGIALAALALSGCVPRQLSTGDVQHLRRVAVVSLLGDSFHGIHIGTTPLNSGSYSADVSGWQIDQRITEHLSTELGGPGLTVTALDLAPRQVEDFYVHSGFADVNADFSEPDYAQLCQLARTQGDDQLLVVARTLNGKTGAPAAGYGFVEHSFLGRTQRHLFAGFVVRLFDVRTMQPLAIGIGDAVEPGPDDPLPWKDRFDDFSAEQKRFVRDEVLGHIRRRLDGELRAMNVPLVPGS